MPNFGLNLQIWLLEKRKNGAVAIIRNTVQRLTKVNAGLAVRRVKIRFEIAKLKALDEKVGTIQDENDKFIGTMTTILNK